MKTPIFTENAPAPIGPYSQAIRVDNFIFSSGQIGMDPQSGELKNNSIEAETETALDNLKAVLEAAGASLSDVIKATVFIKDMNQFNAINAVYNAYFGDSKPARSCVEVARLPKDANVEIEAIAVLG